MIKVVSLLVLLQISNCSSVENEDTVYSVAKDFIVSAKASEEYAKEVFNTTDVNPYVSSELIPYNFSSVEAEVIKRNYLQEYNAFSELSEKEKHIEKNVMDSLNDLNTTFQTETRQSENLNLSLLSEDEPNNFVIFFSEPKDDMLYAELIPYDSNTFKNKKRDTVQQGKALTFLFEFDNNGRIKQVYEGEIYYN